MYFNKERCSINRSTSTTGFKRPFIYPQTTSINNDKSVPSKVTNPYKTKKIKLNAVQDDYTITRNPSKNKTNTTSLNDNFPNPIDNGQVLVSQVLGNDNNSFDTGKGLFANLHEKKRISNKNNNNNNNNNNSNNSNNSYNNSYNNSNNNSYNNNNYNSNNNCNNYSNNYSNNYNNFNNNSYSRQHNYCNNSNSSNNLNGNTTNNNINIATKIMKNSCKEYNGPIPGMSDYTHTAGFSTTPFGVFCHLCESPVGKNKLPNIECLKGHLKNQNKKNIMHPRPRMSYPALVSVLSTSIKEKKGQESEYITGSIKGFHCSACNTSFSKKSTSSMHYSPKKTNSNKRKCTKQDMKMCILATTTCKRVVKYNKCNVLKTSHVDCKMYQITDKEVETQLLPIKRADEDIKPYIPQMLVWMANTKNGTGHSSFLDSVKSKVNDLLSEARLQKNNKGNMHLSFFLIYAETWLRDHAQKDTLLLGTNIRFEIQTFRGLVADGTTDVNNCFTMRSIVNSIWKELKLMLIFIWQHLEDR